MKIIKSTINLILLVAILSFSMVAICSTTRVSCEGNMEKSNVSETKMGDKISAKGSLTILFTKDKAILPGAVLSCLRNRGHSRILCESRTLTQYRILTLDKKSVVYKYIDSVKQHTEIFTGYCRPNTHSRAQ
ncbi:MAG: hypothetical protein CM15mP58_13630 [Burkholderiaceae bacterium]|nr:MAG: hypothetical protein CM15mP58_13630 [Burkholderiaceae bacterium]